MLKNTCRVVVTGGAGFIGSNLIDSLIKQGHEVICIDSFNDNYDPLIKMQNISEHLNNTHFKLVPRNICNRQSILQIFLDNRPDIVIHLAAQAGVRSSIEDPLLYCKVNINGTLNVLDAAAKVGVKKFIFGSSSSVYGINKKVPFSEEDPLLTPISPYAATKIAGEALCHSYALYYSMPTVALRFFTVYGPRQRPDLAIHKFARLILEGKPIPVYGDGSSQRDYTYIADIIKGIDAAIKYEQTTNFYEVFNLGNSETISLKKLISILESTLNKKASIEYLPLQPGDVPQTWADTNKSANCLRFRPCTPIEEGISAFVNWLIAVTDK